MYTTPEFQSTRPVKGATGELVDTALDIAVSIHAPREGRDWRCTKHRRHQ